MRLLFLYEAIAVAMVIVACFADDKNVRAAAIMVAASRIIGDMAWVYLPLSPAQILYDIGFVDFTHTDTRAAVDCVFATIMAVLYIQSWWGIAIWAGFISMLFTHVLRELFFIEYIGYAYAINGLFLAMVSVIVLLGGKGVCLHVRDYMSRFSRHRRYLHRASHSTHEQS